MAAGAAVSPLRAPIRHRQPCEVGPGSRSETATTFVPPPMRREGSLIRAVAAFVAVGSIAASSNILIADAFHPQPQRPAVRSSVSRSSRHRRAVGDRAGAVATEGFGDARAAAPHMSSADNDGGDDGTSRLSCWNPDVRRVMGAVSTVGFIETGYLTYAKLFGGGVPDICGADGGCGSVLDSPYATLNIGGMEVPLAALGCISYGLVAALSLGPLFFEGGVSKDDADETNRLALLSLTTLMATFSSFLLSLLFGVLHASCPFCLLSAGLSITLGTLSWTSGMLPPQNAKLGAQLGLGGAATATIVALGLFVGVDDTMVQSYATVGGKPSSSVVANAADRVLKDMPPPPITTTSSERSLALTSDLVSLNSRMFGAYWCSHCYEQKQRLGYEAMESIPYIECASEGKNSQKPLCKARDVPGYPTWEIGGKLYPGEMELDELEDIVREVMGKKPK